MELLDTCCSKDEKELVFPSFSVVFIHTFMLADGVIRQGVGDVPDVDLGDAFDDMKAKLKPDPKKGALPVSSLAEYINKENVHIVRMKSEVEELLFPSKSFSNNQIARYSVKGFDFRIPVRASKEKNRRGNYVADFPPVDFQGHANVEVSQFFGNIFSLTYRFLFDGFTCRILQADETDHETMGTDDRKIVKATTNHIIGLLSTALGAEYWSDDDVDKKAAGIDLINRIVIDKFWLNSDGEVTVRDADGKLANPGKLEKQQKDKPLEKC